MDQTLFSNPEIKSSLEMIRPKIRVLPAEIIDSKKREHLDDALIVFISNGPLIDRYCQINVEWLQKRLPQLIDEIKEKPEATGVLDDLYAMLFRFVTELDLSMREDLASELREFVSFGLDNRNLFSKIAGLNIEWSRLQMPIAVTKKLLGNEALQNVQNVKKYKDDVDAKVTDWGKSLTEQEDRVKQLKAALETYETGFNFVGLHRGFDALSRIKRKEILASSRWLVIFGFLAVSPLLMELALFAFNLDRIEELKWLFAVSAIPAISLTVLLIYYFRVLLRNVESAKSQLLQIELRKTLCRFIQSYAKYSKQLKEENIDALTKFENVIFSGIVSTDEKLPSTFDGVEQLSNLVKSFKQ